MIAVGQREEEGTVRAPVAVGVVAHLECHLHGTGTVVGVEDFVEIPGGQGGELLGQVHCRPMAEPGQQDMLELLRLAGDPAADVGIGMAEEVDPPAADGIEIAPSVEIVKPDPLGTLDGDQGEGFMVFHLGAGVPDVLQIPLHQFPVCHVCSFVFGR